MKTPAFNETKATQLAAYFLQKSNGSLYLLKLVKLVYIADREAFRELGHPITYDRYASLDFGPIPSQTLNLMNGTVRGNGQWSSMISPRHSYKLSVTDEAEVAYESLSESELEIADNVFEEYGHTPRFDLADMTHSFSEWEDPCGSALHISYSNILEAVGYSNDQAEVALQCIQEQQALEEFFSG